VYADAASDMQIQIDANKQQIDLVWQCALFIMTLTTFMFSSTFEEAIKFYSAAYSFLYIVYAILSYRLSKGENQ
jgi:Ca2+/Na+ antiporter